LIHANEYHAFFYVPLTIEEEDFSSEILS